MSTESNILVPYRKQPFLTIFCLLLSLFFIYAVFESLTEQQVVMSIIFLLMGTLFVVLIFSLILALFKKYQIMLNKVTKELIINRVRQQVINLKYVQGVAYTTTTHKSNTTYFLQLKVTPEVYVSFYHNKANQLDVFKENYEYMFIIVQLVNPKQKEFEALLKGIEECDVPRLTYRDYKQGILREENMTDSNKIFRKIKRRKWINAFFTYFFILLFLFNLLFMFLGSTHGVYW